MLWLLLSRIVSETLPVSSFLLSFGCSLFLASLAVIFDFRSLSALLLLTLLPWLIRVFIPGLHRVAFDNAWLLIWPVWYAGTFLFFLGTRYSAAARIEVLILVLASSAALALGGDWNLDMAAPMLATVKMGAATLVLLAALWNLAGPAGKFPPPGSPGAGSVRRRLSGTASKWLFLLILAALIAILLVLSSRIRREKSLTEGGGVLSSSLFQFDFNDVLSLEPEISLNPELTLLYREDGVPLTRYLRRFTLSGWDEKKGFYRDEKNEPYLVGATPLPQIVPKGSLERENPGFSARTAVRQEYYLVALDPSSLFVLDYPLAIEPWDIWDDASFSRAYAVDSTVTIAGPWELFDAPDGELNPEWQAYYTAGAGGGANAYYKELADGIVSGLSGNWEKAEAIERWFRDNFYYSLKPGLAPDGDQLLWFLEETRRGYCSYFAFAMTRLCRAAGIPSRVAVGFLSDPETSTMGFTPVRADQAHAWVEVWINEYGWISFDPTSSEMAPGEDYPLEFLSPDQWLPLIEEVLSRSGEISVSMDDGKGNTEFSARWYGEVLHFVRNRPFLVVSLLVFLGILVYLPGRILPCAFSLKDRLSKNPGRVARAEWLSYRSKLFRAGFREKPKETIVQWALYLDKNAFPGLAEWTGLYQKALFSPSFGEEDLAAARLIQEKLLPAWHSLPLTKRIRSFLAPDWRSGREA